MKITNLLNMSKTHILRIIICSIVTACILVTVGIFNRVFMYIFIRWNLDIAQSNLETSVPIEYILIVLIWNYVVGFAVAGLCWKYLGFPRVTTIGKYYKRFMDMYLC